MDEHTETKRVVGSLEAAGDVAVERSLIGALSAHNVNLHQAASGPVMASGDVAITQGGCGPVMCSGDVSIRQGGCGPMIARGNVSIEQGGTQSVIAGEARLGSGAFAGIVAAPKVTIEDGAKVLMSTPQAAAFGAALGAALALLLRLRR
ncbi:MAG TPA: hypothetical protein VE669_00400 [Actinomycetota bacterium]|jgi:hypothetical protein|nr:hypothetical protein [Actinomycetota bacterium]